MSLTYALQPHASAALTKSHEMIMSGNFNELSSLLHNDVCFRSPVAFNPYHGIPVASLILTNVGQRFKNFVYYRQFI